MLAQITKFVCTGSILNCGESVFWLNGIKAMLIGDLGIQLIEDAAAKTAIMLRATKVYEKYEIPVWTTNENIEILIRGWMRSELKSLLCQQLPTQTLAELSDVLFDIVYPTYKRNEKD